MEILINNKSYILTQDANLLDVFSAANISDSKGLAIAVNNKVVPRKSWDDFKLSENDKVLLIKATQGG